MKSIMPFIILVGTSGALLSSSGLAAVPAVEAGGQAAIGRCPTNEPTTRIYHSDKIAFMIGGGLKATNPNQQPALDVLRRNTELDTKVRDNPIRVGHVVYKILSFLGAVPTAENAANIKMTDVEYTAVVCPGAQPM